MFSKFKQAAETVVLDTDVTLRTAADTKYNIILSPSLYWVKRVTLPLKYVHEVKKIAPTLFEENLLDGNYNYFVYKEEETFLVFAYEDSKIIALLSQKGIALQNVAFLSFAQFTFKDLQAPLKITPQKVLVKKEGIVLLLPADWYDDAKPLESYKLTASKPTIHLEQFSHIVDSKTLYKVISILGLFIVVLLGEYYYYYKQGEQLETARSELFTSYKLKPTLMQNKAILSHYEKIDAKQKKLREYISYFLKAPLQKNQKITTIFYSDALLRVTIEGVNKKSVKALLSKLYKAGVDVNLRSAKDKTIVEVKL